MECVRRYIHFCLILLAASTVGVGSRAIAQPSNADLALSFTNSSAFAASLGQYFKCSIAFAPQEQGVRVELLDTSRPAFDGCVADNQFAENLIRAAAEGQDVFHIARASVYQWEHTDLA